MNVDLYLDGSALSDGREKEAVVATGVSFQNREGATSLITVSDPKKQHWVGANEFSDFRIEFFWRMDDTMFFCSSPDRLPS